MSLCFSGMGCLTQATDVLVSVSENHPLMRLSRALPWDKLLETVLPDLQKTKNGCWWLGRKLKIRIHLGIYLLQHLSNKTDRQIEYDVKDNGAYQIFCGHGIVDRWHVPDHTKIESFRSRLSKATQQSLANLIARHAVDLGFADPSDIDIDSTIQEANMHYPADSCLLKKLGTMSHKVAIFLNKTLDECITTPLQVNIKKIGKVARSYFFLPKNSTKAVKDDRLMELLHVVQEETKAVIECCKNLSTDVVKQASWGVRRTIEQISELATQYLEDVKYFLTEGMMAPSKILSFHLKEVACFTKGKLGKKYQFGRCIQLGRIKGNFLFVPKSTTVQMSDKISMEAVIDCHQALFDQAKISSVATDKGYYSQANEKYLVSKKVDEVAIQRPKNIKKCSATPLLETRTEELINRRSGIEPLIGHVKHGGQLGRSRMKSDRGIECSSYTAVLGFNMRQLIRAQKPPNKLKSA